MAVPNQNFTIYQGTSLEITGVVVDENEAVKDITGFGVTWVLWDVKGIRITKQVGSGITLTDPANGEFKVTVTIEESKELWGDYEHEARAIDGAGNEDVVFVGIGTVERSRSRV